jgi:hypothetical protein
MIRVVKRTWLGTLCALAAPVAAFAAGPLDTLPAGRWYEFPNSRMEAVAPNPGVDGSVKSVMFAWSGGVFDSDRDQLVVWGGGHMDYAGNEVYAFGPLSSATPTWRRLSNPSNPPARDTSYAPDGRPVSRHTYNLLDYMPAPYNKMVSCAIGSGYSSGSGWGAMDFYDFTIDGYTGQPWTRGPTPPSNRWPLNAFCAYNPVTKRLWYQDMGNGGARLQQYNPETNTWTMHANFNPDSEPTPSIDTKRNLLVSVGRLNGTRVYDLNSPDSAPVRVTTTGPKDVEDGKFPGFAYDPVNDQFVGWDGGSAVYTLSIPANWRTGTWTWARIPLDSGNTVTPTGVAGPKIVGYETGTFGRFRYVPSRHGVIIVNATDESVYFFKLPNNGGRPLPAVSLSANPTNVSAQGTSTITWTTTNATTCTASGAWSGSKATSGSEAVGPLTTNSTYTLTCDNGAGGTGSGTTTVTVTSNTPAPTLDFAANPTQVAANGSSTLTWSTSNATSCTASGGWTGTRATQGSASVGPLTQGTTYTLACTGAGGSITRNVTVNVTQAAPMPTVSISATPASIQSGQSSTVSWTTQNATSCTASGAWSGSRGTSGNQAVSPTANATYTLACSNTTGTTTQSTTVTVTAPPPTLVFSASPSSIQAGATSTLTWSSQNASSCTASGGWTGTRTTSGSSTVTPTSTTTYTLACTGASGNTQQSTTVTVSAAPPPAPAPTLQLTTSAPSVASGGRVNINWVAANATSCNASGGWTGAKATSGTEQSPVITANTTFSLSCVGAGGSVTQSAAVTLATTPPPTAQPPTLQFTASATTVNSGSPVTLSWNAVNATSCTASGSWGGSKPLSASETTAPLSADSNFTLTCTGAGGSKAESVIVAVNAAPTNDPNGAPEEVEVGGSFDALTLGAFGLLTIGMLWQRSRRRAAVMPALAASVALAVGVVPQVQAADIVSITMQSTASSAQSNVPVTFGHVFKPGDVGAGIGIRARTASGTDIPLQVDRKATHADGSLRHAVLTLTLPSLGANGSEIITLSTGTSASGTAVALSDLLATSYDATASLDVGGTTYSASARQALQQSPLTWLSGPQVSEWIVRAPVRTSSGTSHPHLTAYFHVRAYGGSPITRVRTDVVIENNWTMVPSPGNFTYNANLAVTGGQSYTRAGLSHYSHTRWHRALWWGAVPAVYARHDKNYLQDTRAIPKYENLTPTEGFLNSVRQTTDPMTNGDQTDNMEQTGYQAGIGPLPQWDAIYAVSTDRRAFNYMLANADGGAAYSVHFRDENTGLPVTIDSYPNSTLADPQASSPRIPESGGSPYNVVWSAHQPSIGFLPYLVTGDYYFLEKMQFWSAYNLIWPSVSNRGGNKGWWYTQSLRGQAWAYRSLAQAAYATPDAHPLKAYFNAKLSNNIQRDISLYVSPGGPHKNNLGAMYMAEGNEQYRFYDYFMSWTVQYLVDLGFTEAIPFRDYKVKFPIGLMGSGANEYCFQAAAQYTWRVGPTGTSTFYPDWRTVFTNTVSSAVAGATCGTQSMTSALGLSRLNEINGGQNETGYYFANLQPAVAAAADSGVPGGQLAWERTQLSGIKPDYRDNPIWAIVPRGSVQPSVSANLTANPQTVAPGGSVTLSWTSTRATSCSASGGWAGAKGLTGSESIGPLNANASFTLTCTDGTQQATSTALVTVSQPAPVVTLNAAASQVQAGASTTLTWSTTNAQSCTASGGWSGTKATSGSETTPALTANTTFTLTCTGAGSTTGTASRTVTVIQPAPVVTFTANPASIASGASSTLTWSATNATSCTASGGWTGTKSTSGTESTGALTASRSYTLSCSGAGGSAQQSVTVNVQGAPTPGPVVSLNAASNSVVSGSNASLTWSSQNATACTASGGWSGTKATSGTQSVGPLTTNTTFTLTCTGAGGSGLANVAVTVTAPPTTPPPPPPAAAPTVTLSSSVDTVSPAGSATLTWSSTNATSCSATGAWSGTKATSGSQSVGPLNADSTFTLTCTGAGGSANQSKTVTVLSNTPNDTPQPEQVRVGSFDWPALFGLFLGSLFVFRRRLRVVAACA